MSTRAGLIFVENTHLPWQGIRPQIYHPAFSPITVLNMVCGLKKTVVLYVIGIGCRHVYINHFLIHLIHKMSMCYGNYVCASFILQNMEQILVKFNNGKG
jgi:hypothetical protein